MHRHVRHLVNTCHIESLIQDLELFPFQGICSVSIITESAIQQSLHYEGGKKLEKSLRVSRHYELKWPPPFYHLHGSSAKTTQNLRWKINQLTNQATYNISLLTNPDHPVFFTLYPRGDGERRRQGKEEERQRGWERQPVTQRKRMDWDEEQRGECREGEGWGNRKYKKDGSQLPSFSPVSHFSILWKSTCRFGHLILVLWPAQMSHLLFMEINLGLHVFNVYNDMSVAFDIPGSCSLKPSTKSRNTAQSSCRNTLHG